MNVQLVQRYALGISLLLLIGTGGLYAAQNYNQKAAPEESLSPDPFLNVPLTAKAAYVYDTISGEVLFAQHEEIQLPLASVTKLMTALVAAESIPNSTSVLITRSSINIEGDSGLSIGEEWSLKNLIPFVLTTSSNDGAHALAAAAAGSEALFAEKMSEKSRSLNLSQTYFINATGLDQGGASGGYGSARDVGHLLAYILERHPEIVNGTERESVTLSSEDTLHKAENTNQIVGAIPGLIASKTGFTDLAGGNLAVAFDASLNHPIVVVVLGSTAEGRFEDVLRLSTLAREKVFHATPIF